METKERDWLYLLPSGETAENMMQGRKLLEKQTGEFITSWLFRTLVKKGVIKKVNRYTNDIISQGNVRNNKEAGTSR